MTESRRAFAQHFVDPELIVLRKSGGDHAQFVCGEMRPAVMELDEWMKKQGLRWEDVAKIAATIVVEFKQ